MKDERLERRLVQEFPLDREVVASIADVDRQLHDAWLDVESMERDGDHVLIPGHWESRLGRGFVRPRGRFPIRLRATGVASVEFEDDEGLGGIMVCEARSADACTGIHVEGCIPARLRLLGEDLRLFVTIASKPNEVKPLFGAWRAVE